MLGSHYRLVAVNSQGASATVTVKIKRSKFNSDATPNFEASPVTLLNAVSVGAGGNSASAAIDNTNTTDKWLFAEIEFTVVATTTGNVALYLARSVDGGTTWPDVSRGQLVASLDFTASGTQRRVVAVD